MLINDFINTVSNKVFGKDNGVKVNNTKVQQIVTDTSNIATSIVTSARDNVAAAIDELNKVAEKAGTVQVENINSLFNEIGSSIEAIGTKLQEKVKQVESYSKGSSSSISFAIVTPSFVMSGAPYFLSRTTFLPLGPSVTFTVSAS